jgi:hypothetical protein
MKKHVVFLAIFFIAISCQEDSGFREVVTEIEIGTPEYGTICSSIELYTEPPFVQGPNNDGGCIGTTNGKLTSVTEPFAYAVGTNLSYDFRIDAQVMSFNDLGQPYYVDTTISSAVTIRVKANNKVVWSKEYKKGDRPSNNQEFGNIVIR